MNTWRTSILSENELRAAAGNVDEATVLEILNLQPTLAALEEAVAVGIGRRRRAWEKRTPVERESG